MLLDMTFIRPWADATTAERKNVPPKTAPYQAEPVFLKALPRKHQVVGEEEAAAMVAEVGETADEVEEGAEPMNL